MYDLCLAISCPHPDYLDGYLTGRQLLDWQAYARQYGLPARRDDLHHGMSMALLYNINRSEKASAEPPSAFMPYHDQFGEDISKEQLENKLRSVLAGIHTVDEQQG